MLNLNITFDGDTATVWVTGTEGRNEREQLPVDHPAMQRLLEAITAATLVGRQERFRTHRPTGLPDH